ncbi:MAG: thioredoxin domain-containing protein [Acidobacteriota bacterium]|nr:thioredoxin domain-containing protein [Acidobacteriota bacterium]MDH3786422.1 thioredoxin domain-containing protein [Acidobacteriota bacterium]
MSATRLLTALILVAGLCVLGGCSPADTQANTNTTAPDKVVATVGSETITQSDLESAASGGLRNLEQQRYELLSTKLTEMMRQSMLRQEGESRGMTAGELEAAEIDANVLNPTQDEVQTFFDENREQTGKYTLDDVRSSIIKLLRNQREQALRTAFYASLDAKYSSERSLTIPRIDVGRSDNELLRGSASAPITIVEYGDFQCPYCRRAHVVVDRVMAEYGDQVQFIFRDYPLENHKRAIPASKAAYCAEEQGKFWDYYDHLMLMKGDLSDQDLFGRAQQLSIDTDVFGECFRSSRYEDLIASNQQHGTDLGVKVTPTFFVNGRMVVGVKEFDAWKLILDEELFLAAKQRG